MKAVEHLNAAGEIQGLTVFDDDYVEAVCEGVRPEDRLEYQSLKRTLRKLVARGSGATVEALALQQLGDGLLASGAIKAAAVRPVVT